MNNLNHLKKLSKVKSGKGINFFTPLAYPGSHCPMHSALAMVTRIKGLSSLLIGTNECGHYSRNMITMPANSNGDIHWTYIMDSSDIVFGCRAKLVDAVKEMDKRGPKAIILFNTCIPEIIGEDIDAVVHEAQKHVNARLVRAVIPHFRCNSQSSGSINTLEAITGIMDKKDLLPNRVNVLGYQPMMSMMTGMPAPMPKLIDILKKDCDVKYYSFISTLDSYMEASDAALNIVYSSGFVPFAMSMKEKFGIPFITMHDIYSADDFDKAISDVETSLGKELAPEFTEEREMTKTIEESAKKALAGVSFVMTHTFANNVPLTAYLTQLGMIPVLINMDDAYVEDAKWTAVINNAGIDPLVCHMVNGRADALMLESVPFDIHIGRMEYLDEKIPSVNGMIPLSQLHEYKRTATLLKEIIATAQKSGELHGVI